MGILIVSNFEGLGCANWVLRALAEDIAEILKETQSTELADWLVSEESPIYLYSDLDVRDLTPENQKAFREAIHPAYNRSKSKGPVGWNDPSAWEGYIGLFKKLADQIDSVNRGNTEFDLPYLREISEHKGLRSGPGW